MKVDFVIIFGFNMKVDFFFRIYYESLLLGIYKVKQNKNK